MATIPVTLPAVGVSNGRAITTGRLVRSPFAGIVKTNGTASRGPATIRPAASRANSMVAPKRLASCVSLTMLKLPVASMLSPLITEIAKDAGVTAALVHYYFGPLDDLFLAVLRRRAEQQFDHARHHIGFRNRLAQANRQASVFIRLTDQRGIDKTVPLNGMQG